VRPGGIENAQKSVPQMLEDFKQHPAVRPLIEGGTLLEYSAHLVPEGGIEMLPKLAGDGVLVVGDAAGMCLNLGFTVRGMDLAIEAANIAAQTIIAAKESNDFSLPGLKNTRRRWRKAASCRICGIIASCLA
jgi:electron transfer flavoprotein-quinone oxidoreductase